MVWDYKNADFDRCNEYISSFDWDSILHADNSMDLNCENCTNKFIEFIKNVYHKRRLQLDKTIKFGLIPNYEEKLESETGFISMLEDPKQFLT